MKTFTPTKTVHDLIHEVYLTDLPIGSGTGSIDDPIIMLVDIEYVHNEYEVLEYLGYYRDVEWERAGQKLFQLDGKYLDGLTISVSDPMDESGSCWKETYYFNVNDCIENSANMPDEVITISI